MHIIHRDELYSPTTYISLCLVTLKEKGTFGSAPSIRSQHVVSGRVTDEVKSEIF